MKHWVQPNRLAETWPSYASWCQCQLQLHGRNLEGNAVRSLQVFC